MEGTASAHAAALWAGLHLILHLARGGWVRWRTELPPIPPRPNQKSGLAVRVILDDESGFLIHSLEQRILDRSPFETIDGPGVGWLVRLAA